MPAYSSLPPDEREDVLQLLTRHGSQVAVASPDGLGAVVVPAHLTDGKVEGAAQHGFRVSRCGQQQVQERPLAQRKHVFDGEGEGQVGGVMVPHVTAVGLVEADVDEGPAPRGQVDGVRMDGVQLPTSLLADVEIIEWLKAAQSAVHGLSLPAGHSHVHVIIPGHETVMAPRAQQTATVEKEGQGRLSHGRRKGRDDIARDAAVPGTQPGRKGSKMAIKSRVQPRGRSEFM